MRREKHPERERRFRVYFGTKGRPQIASGLVTEAHAVRLVGELGPGHYYQGVNTRECSQCDRRVLARLICTRCGAVARRAG